MFMIDTYNSLYPIFSNFTIISVLTILMKLSDQCITVCQPTDHCPSCCSFSMLHFFLTAPLRCCTFSCSNFFILPFFPFELFLCIALFHVAILHFEMFSFSILLLLHSSRVAIVLCCTLLMLHYFQRCNQEPHKHLRWRALR